MELLERFWHQRPSRDWVADDYGLLFPEGKDWRISFRALSVLFVSSAVFRPLRPEFPFPWGHPRDAFRFFELTHEAAQGTENDARVFTDPDWALSQFEQVWRRIPDIDQTQLLKLIALHQARVELNEGIPIRLFPFSRDPTPDAPSKVAIDPEIRFGRPTVKGAPTDVLAERWRAGDNSAELAEDYGLTTEEVDEALRYEALLYKPMSIFPFDW
jgi:uncharacterized protein (DUF433 family)